MRRFRFRLDKVLKLRAHGERAARRVLAEKLSQLGVLEDDMRGVDHNLAVCRDDDSANCAAGLARALEAGLLRRRRRLTSDIEAAEQRLDLARDAYREARVDHRAMSNLRARRFETWWREVEAETQAEFDEMARTRFLLRKAKR
ncbi:MAG: hypothetical protein ACYTGW_05605 [Planctomycetota bacterium]|jgi:flagellar export protein FliJ